METLRDVSEGLKGAVGMLWGWLTPMLRDERAHWGVTEEEAEAPHPGDVLVPEPRWKWTHGVYIDARPEEIWPWVVQMGRDRGGFYSYQFLERLAGYHHESADHVHDEWQELKVGEALRWHEWLPEVRVALVDPNRHFVMHTRADLDLHRELEPFEALPGRFVNATWGFFLRPQPGGDTQLVSRFRCDYSDDAGARREYGERRLEPVSYVMDRRLLEEVKRRVERSKAPDRTA